MIPLMLEGKIAFYSTLFIFLINRVIDLFFQEVHNPCKFLKHWETVNTLLGAVICALSFCLLIQEFRCLFGCYVSYVNYIIFLFVVNYIIKEVVELVLFKLKHEVALEKLAKSVASMRGVEKK